VKYVRKPTLVESTELWLSMVLRHLPVSWTSAIGGYFGARQARKAIAEERLWVRRLHGHLERFSDVKDENERNHRIVEYTRRIGRIYAEFTVLQRLVKAGRVEVVGGEHLQELSSPAIIISSHLSNWELVGHALTLLKGAGSVLYDPPENPVRHRLADEARLGWRGGRDGELIPATSHAMLKVTRAIARGRNLLMYVDEEKDGYIRAPALGREITYTGNRWLTARLAASYGADVVPIHVETIGPARYRIVIEPKLLPGEGDTETRARSLVDQMEQHLDAWVRAQPEQWYWLSLLELETHTPSSG